LIFDGVVAPKGEVAGDVFPAASQLLVQLEEPDFFLDRPLFFVEIWLKMMEPSGELTFRDTVWPNEGIRPK